MNIFLWALQVLLALYYLMGGSWMVFKVPAVWLKLLSKPVWMAIGLIQTLFALGLVLPAAVGVLPILTPIAAVGVAVETLLVSTVTKPKFQGMLWIVVPGLLALFVAYARFVLIPL